MTNPEAGQLFDNGMQALTEGNIIAALSFFEKALAKGDDPLISSFFAFCIAKERGEIKKAISLCTDAIKEEPENSFHYLNLGKIYLIRKDRKEPHPLR